MSLSRLSVNGYGQPTPQMEEWRAQMKLKLHLEVVVEVLGRWPDDQFNCIAIECAHLINPLVGSREGGVMDQIFDPVKPDLRKYNEDLRRYLRAQMFRGVSAVVIRPLPPENPLNSIALMVGRSLDEYVRGRSTSDLDP